MDDNSIPSFPASWSSSRWLKSKLYPDLEPYYRKAIVSILETGLLFKEDALQLEDGLQIDDVYYDGKKKYKFINIKFTSGERILSAVAVGIFIAVMPIKLSMGYRGNLCRALCWAGAGISVPILHRLMVPNTLPVLLTALSDYTILVRKCMSCVREQSMHPRSPRSMSVNAMNAVLIEQQRDLCLMFERANTVLQPLFPWLTTSPLFEISLELSSITNNENLIKLHHLFLILQSYFLKTVALGHLRKQTKNTSVKRDEKILWIHNTVFPVISESVEYHSSSLNNAYRIFKDINVNRDSVTKTMPKIAREPWQYSEVHANIVLCSSEIRSALIKSNEMDTFLEACWNAKSKFSPAILEDDLIKLKEDVMKCFATIDNISIQLKKIHTAEMKLLEQAVQKLHLPAVEEEEIDVPNVKTVSEDTVLDIKDEVYYFEKTDDFNPSVSSAQDYFTGPGANEIKTTKVVLEELKVKLVKREDDMRHREEIALENTMPEYKGNLPEFPRQIICDNGNNVKEDISMALINNEKDESTSTNKSGLIKEVIAFNDILKKDSIVTNGCDTTKTDDGSNINGDFKDESNIKKTVYDIVNVENNAMAVSDESKFQDDSDSDPKVLADIRKDRIAKKKKYPSGNYKFVNRDAGCSDDNLSAANDENKTNDGSEPTEYRFGTGMAMASLLHAAKPNTNAYAYSNYEETYAGSGEVSEDSGNET